MASGAGAGAASKLGEGHVLDGLVEVGEAPLEMEPRGE